MHWPRTGRFYDPVAPAEFVDFGAVADAPDIAAPTGALAGHIAKTGTVRATAYTELVDLLLGLEGVLYATDAAAEDEDPVIDPDGCAWIAGGLERFVEGHTRYGDLVTFDTVSSVMQSAVAGGDSPSSSCAGSNSGWPGCATRRAGLHTGASPVRNWLFCRASTAGVPIGASPSSPIIERTRIIPGSTTQTQMTVSSPRGRAHGSGR